MLNKYQYIEYKTENSKWLLSKDSLVMGFRKQWSKNQSIISIDIAELSDSIDSQIASEFRSTIAFGPLCILDINESISTAIDDWFNKWNNLELVNYISIVGRKGNLSIHFYYFNNSGIDPKIASEIVKAIN